jgi:formylglycine-generating enzyme required for sulfatase activity
VIGDVAWYDGNSGYRTHPVGTKKANELGIHDMSGNVMEWVYDWFDYYSGNPQKDPKGPSSGEQRGLRGGSWFASAIIARVSLRELNYPDGRGGNMGFRLVRSPK